MTLNSEVEMAKSISWRRSGGRNGFLGNFTSGQPRASQNVTERTMKFLDSREPLFYWTLTVLCMISTWSDSFFLYSFKANDLKNCLELESHAAIAAAVCRTVFDFLIIFPCINERGKEGDTVIRRQKSLYFWLDVILSNFPLPQLVVISIMIGRMSSFTPFYALWMLKYVIIFQYLPRVLRIYRFYRQAESADGILTQHIWVNVSCCFLIYPLAGQILGGLCYLLAIERLTECWRMAGNTIVYTMIVDTTVFYFGMFQEVILSGVLEKDLMTRFMFCFKWGLQTIRSLGGNFNTSTDVWENLFAVFIFLFVIFITVLVLGKLQILLLSKYRRLVDMRLKVQEIVRSKTFKMLSTNRREQIKSHLQYVWQETGVVDGQHFLDILPSGLQEEVLRELCLEMLKKVYVFKRRFDEKILEEMYSYLKPKFYAERHSIVRKDDRIKEMLFIKHGTILSTMTANDSSSEDEEYRDGEFWGEEIAISCLHPHWHLEPMSKVNVIAATKVQAFALKLDDIKKGLEKISKLPNRYSEQWRTKNARIIQKAWRTYKKKKKCSILFDYRIPKGGLESCSVGAAAMDSPLQMNGLPLSVYAPETVGCVVLDREGQCAAATSTGGLMNKMSGRIGNSSLIGAAACAVSCTGEGEAIIRGTMAVMEYEGLELQEAVDFFKKERLDDGQAGLTAVSKKGEVACGFISS